MNLKINQVISHKDGSKRKVLEVFVNTILVSSSDMFDSVGGIYTQEGLIESGWIIPKEEWQPEKREKYWYINESGTVGESHWDGFELDKERKSFLGIYPSKEAAEKALEEIKAKIGK